MKKILIVEDELSYITLLRDQLISRGYRVIEAPNGKIGFETALKEKPDLILLDIRMPVMDGLTMLKQLRQNAWGKDANVIVLTNFDDSIEISAAMNAKVSRYLIKSDLSFSSLMNDIKIPLHE